MIKATVIFGEDAVRRYDDTDKVPSEKWLKSNGGVVDILTFSSKAEYDSYYKALADMDGWNDAAILEPEYDQTEKDKINSQIMELSSELAEKELVDKHQILPEDMYDGANYKEEYQDEFNSLYDKYYSQLSQLAKFEY